MPFPSSVIGQACFTFNQMKRLAFCPSPSILVAMRFFRIFVLLAVPSLVLQLVLVVFGGTEPASRTWRILLHAGDLPPVSARIIIAISAILSTGWLWVALRNRVRDSLAVAAGLWVLSLGASASALPFGLFLDPLPLLSGVCVSILLLLAYRQTRLGSREPVLRRLFGQRLKPEIFRRLVEGSAPVTFPGELHEASVLVCTVHNHVDLMEVLSPGDYVAMMNLYLRAASGFLVDLGGYLDECSGESIRVVFGAPLPCADGPGHAARAARAAIDLLARLEDLNRECDSRWQKRLDFRIGLNSGQMIAAAFGGARAGRYSVSGPVVEFARHLSAACAQYGCRILAGPLSYEQAAPFVEARPIDLLQRAGSRRRVELYEFLAPKDRLSPERERSRDLFWKGIILFRERKWDEAIRAFSSARIHGIPDQVLDHYLERVERARRGEDEPTPEQAILAEAV
jgi:adenylate cyclase